MDKLKQESVDLTEQNIDKIGAMFPNVITETKDENGNLKKAINFTLLKQMLSKEVVDGDECYEFTWVGKKQSIIEGNTPIRKTLRPCKEESKDWDKTENLYIEGDNLEVLKLLQGSYLNAIKMIYIDPPYNTGNDFVYRDNFAMSKEEYDEESGLFDEDENRLFKNSKTNGRYHSDWCSMMYPRLQLARNLLTDDGVIFISIDDNEVDNLRKICDEVFGEANFVACLAVQLNPRGRHLDKFIAKTHESVVIYGKNTTLSTTMKGVEKEGKMLDEYNLKDEKGPYRLLGLRNRNQAFNPTTRPKLFYPLYVDKKTRAVSILKDEIFTEEVWPITSDGVKTCWTWGKDKVEKESNLLEATQVQGEWRVNRKDYLLDEDGTTSRTLAKSIWLDKEINNDVGKKSIKQLFGETVMDFPKSPELIIKLILIGASELDIILDFFSGSSTTAHAVMQLNAEDGGNRKFIMVQLPEETDAKSEANKAGYKNICEIGKERIRRAGEKINAEFETRKAELKKKDTLKFNFDETDNSESSIKNSTLDTGFRVLKLDTTNMKDVYYSPAEYSQQMLLNLESNIKEDRTDLDLLFGVLVDWGVPLSLPLQTKEIEGKAVHFVNDTDLVACFEEGISESLIREVAKAKPMRVVFRDSSFANSPDKINVTEIFKTISPDTTIKVI